ncbi:hypothetical protein I5M32_09935 [Pedobacter sp. SD-b]|uniref:Tetratricopeptide repeat-containing protein n=1 Tax=Pedobacter segetis TaxID=2793069 RepID=A0ABS1BK57_9SPHI|nr:tetratricopeptide repeat protein [Pedobacter segetis]MBK0383279.1 hypothetical protein [Pedobacter segetis]
MNKTDKNVALLSILAFIILIAAYANHFHNGFHFDDFHTIVNNLYIRNLSNIPAFFHDPRMFSVDPEHWGLRPMVTTTLAIDYWLANGLNPFYFQLSTFVWYVILGVMIFFMYKNLLQKVSASTWIPYIALFATSWYMLNTANAETVNYIISRSDVLSTFCVVAAFLIYIAYPNKRKYYLYIIPAFIGIFFKEIMPVLIILLFFYILLFERNLSISDLFKTTNFKYLIKTVVTLLPLTIINLVTQYYLMSANTAIQGTTNPFVPYVLTQTYVWIHYFISFFLPTSLSADTDFTIIKNLLDERIIMGFIFIILYATVIFKTSKKPQTRPIAFGLIWFGAALLPTSLAPLAEVTNDHRMFFPFIGLAFSATYSIALYLINHENKLKNNQLAKISLIAVAICILGLNTYGVTQRNKVWKSESSLWLDVTQKSPENGRGFMNYGLTQMEVGNYKDAISNFEKAKLLTPKYGAVYINLGVAKNAIGLPQEAEENFKKAISLNPESYKPYQFYTKYLIQNNRYEDAKEVGEKALAINPTSSDVYELLLKTYNQLQDWEKLTTTAKDYLEILPNNELAKKYLAAGLNKTPYYTEAENNDNKTKITNYINQSLAMYNAGKYQECINLCQKVLKLDSNKIEAYINIGAANNMLKNWEEGIKYLNKALAINPNDKLAIGNLNWAKSELKKKDK